MKITKIVIVNDEGIEETLDIKDAVVLAVTEDQKVLTQTSDNDGINMTMLRLIMKPKEIKE
jgi:hypothetical protein